MSDDEGYYVDGIHDPPGWGEKETSRPRRGTVFVALGAIVLVTFLLIAGLSRLGGTSPGQELTDQAADFIAEHPATEENRAALAALFADNPCEVFDINVELGEVGQDLPPDYYKAVRTFGPQYDTVRGEKFTLLLGATCP